MVEKMGYKYPEEKEVANKRMIEEGVGYSRKEYVCLMRAGIGKREHEECIGKSKQVEEKIQMVTLFSLM